MQAEPGASALTGDTPRLALRLRDAARVLSVSERTLWSWTKKNGVPHIRHGRCILYSVRALEEWLAQQASGLER